jgi:hypothetical protein
LRFEYGAPTRTRTADLLITNQLLYQLSYRGTLRQSKPGGRVAQGFSLSFQTKEVSK